MILAVSPENVDKVKSLLDEEVYQVGRIVEKEDKSVIFK